MSLLPDPCDNARTQFSPLAEALVNAAIGPELSALLHADRGDVLATAWAAMLLAGACEPDPALSQQAFRTAVFSGLPGLILRQSFPKGYDRCQRAAASGAERLRGQRRVLGVDERQILECLAWRWRLPPRMAELALAIDQPGRPDGHDGRVVEIVRLARAMTAQLGLNAGSAAHDDSEYARLAAQAGLSTEQLRRIERVAKNDIATWAASLLRPAPRDSPVQATLPAGPVAAAADTQSLVLRSILEFDRALGSSIDLPATVTAIARAGEILFGDACAGALAVCHVTPEIEIVLRNADARSQRRELPPDLIHALRQCGRPQQAFVPLDAKLTRALNAQPAESTAGLRLAPLCQEQRTLGAILLDAGPDIFAEPEARALFAKTSAMFAQAIARANENTQSRRLTEELADSNRQLQAMQAELLRSRTLATMAEMAAGAGHELNGPLAVISGRAQLLAGRTDDGELRRVLELISNKAHECSQIVSELMDFAKPPPPQCAEVSLRELLEQARQEALQRTGLPETQLVLRAPNRPAERDVRACVDPGQILTAVVELLKNAGEAVRAANGKISLEWGIHSEPAGTLDGGRAAPAAPRLVIQVSDTGEGMPPQVVQRAFDPFYSHRKAGRGRGLGLARAARIADAHGGRIQIESKVGVGTTVKLLVPLRPAAAETAGADLPPQPQPL